MSAPILLGGYIFFAVSSSSKFIHYGATDITGWENVLMFFMHGLIVAISGVRIIQIAKNEI